VADTEFIDIQDTEYLDTQDTEFLQSEAGTGPEALIVSLDALIASVEASVPFQYEIDKLTGAYPINLYIVNASLSGYDPMYYADINQDIYGYAMDANGNMTDVEVVYTGLPIQREALKSDIQGALPEIKISVPNTDRVMEAVIQNYNYLRGRDITCLTTFAPYLPCGHPGGAEVDDETGVSELNMISTIDGNSFVDFTDINNGFTV